MTSKRSRTGKKPKYLGARDIVLIHSTLIGETGGSHGIRDRERVEAIIARPQQEVFGKRLCPTLWDQAASYGHDIIRNHPFVDGNKRTGMTVMMLYLELNGLKTAVPKGEIERIAVRIAEEKLSYEEIAGWLKSSAA